MTAWTSIVEWVTGAVTAEMVDDHVIRCVVPVAGFPDRVVFVRLLRSPDDTKMVQVDVLLGPVAAVRLDDAFDQFGDLSLGRLSSMGGSLTFGTTIPASALGGASQGSFLDHVLEIARSGHVLDEQLPLREARY